MSVKFLEELVPFEMVPVFNRKFEPIIPARTSKTTVSEGPFFEGRIFMGNEVRVEFNEYYFWESKPNPLSGIL